MDLGILSAFCGAFLSTLFPEELLFSFLRRLCHPQLVQSIWAIVFRWSFFHYRFLQLNRKPLFSLFWSLSRPLRVQTAVSLKKLWKKIRFLRETISLDLQLLLMFLSFCNSSFNFFLDEMACYVVSFGYFYGFRVFFLADTHNIGASWMKSTPWRRFQKIRWKTWNWSHFCLGCFDAWKSFNQALRVWV